MNNNTRGFVALLFLDVIVPMTAPPALNQATASSGEARGSEIAESRSGRSNVASEQLSTPVYVS